jgi:hypothetical protein
VKEGRSRAARQLTNRFQEAIDAAAMKAGLIGTDEYLAEWRSAEAVEQAGEPEAVAESVAAALEAAYGDERLLSLVNNQGRDI